MPRDEVLDMQVRIFRKFGTRHHIAPKETLSIFEKFDILGFISECYELLHAAYIPVPDQGISPDSSHEYSVIEYSNYQYVGIITVTKEEAKIKDAIKAKIGGLLGGFLAASVPPGTAQIFWMGVSEMSVEQMIIHILSKEPMARWGDYELSVRYKTQYLVNYRTGKRTLANQWVCTNYTLRQDGSFIDQYETCVHFK